MEVSMVPERPTAPTPAPLTHDQVEACCRLHRRIRVRTNAIRRLLEPDPAHDELMEVVLELLVDIKASKFLIADALVEHLPDQTARAMGDSAIVELKSRNLQNDASQAHENPS